MKLTGGHTADPRVRAIEWLPWAIAALCYFAAPTYLFIVSVMLLIVVGLVKMALGSFYQEITDFTHGTDRIALPFAVASSQTINRCFERRRQSGRRSRHS